MKKIMKITLLVALLQYCWVNSLWATEDSKISPQTISKDIKTVPKIRNYKLSLYTSMSLDGASYSESSYENTSAYGYAQFDYKWGESQTYSLTLRPYFTYTPAKDGGLEADDFMFSYSDSKFLNLFKKDVGLEVRYYLPVSDSSQESGKNTIVFYSFIGGELGQGWSWEFEEYDPISLYSKDESGQTALELIHTLSFYKSIFKKLRFGTSFSYTNQFTNTGVSQSLTKKLRDEMKNETLVSYSPSTKNSMGLTFKLSSKLGPITAEMAAEQVRDLADTSSFDLFDKKEMTYYLNLSTSL